MYFRTIACITIISLNVLIGAAQETEVVKIDLGNLKRFYKVSDSIYRSEQPNKKEFRAMEELGIRSVLNFRRNVRDDKKAAATNLSLIHQPLKSKTLDQDGVIEALRNIHYSSKPVLVHCWHGSDRTGVIIAAYRIIFDGWTKEKAIAEFRKPEFGYHENWYPFLVDLLNNLDVETVRAEVIEQKNLKSN